MDHHHSMHLEFCSAMIFIKGQPFADAFFFFFCWWLKYSCLSLEFVLANRSLKLENRSTINHSWNIGTLVQSSEIYRSLEWLQLVIRKLSGTVCASPGKKKHHSSLNSDSSSMGHFICCTHVSMVDRPKTAGDKWIEWDRWWLWIHAMGIYRHLTSITQIGFSMVHFSPRSSLSVAWFLDFITLFKQWIYFFLQLPRCELLLHGSILQQISLLSFQPCWLYQILPLSNFLKSVLCDCIVLRYERLSWSSLAGLILSWNCRNM